MANKSIPLKDKQLVIQRLAEGQSTRQAIQGTSIASNQTAARIAKSYSHAIRQYRQEYLDLIESSGLGLGSRENRAKLLGDMVWATKTMHCLLPPHRDPFMPLGRREAFIEVEDWPTRLKAIQYIDKLAGVNTGTSPVQLNVMQQQSNSM